MVYLWKRYNGNGVVFYGNLVSAAKNGYTTKPDLTATDQEWSANNATAYIQGDKIVLGYSPDKKKKIEIMQKKQIRNQLLEETDKYMISDYPISEEYKAKISAYRKILRDLPENENWPYVEIPEIPTEDKTAEESSAKTAVETSTEE